MIKKTSASPISQTFSVQTTFPQVLGKDEGQRSAWCLNPLGSDAHLNVTCISTTLLSSGVRLFECV